MNKQIEDFLRATNSKLNYNSANNAPIILNDYPIGIVKNYNESGFIECILWDKYINIEASFDENKDGTINALIIDNKNNRGE